MDTFQKFTDFIDSDIRTQRRHPNGYTVTYEMMLARHRALLPKESIENSSVLDLGCCVGTTGAWVLDNGALEYTGVELQKDFVEKSTKNLSEHFPKKNWKIIQSSLESFLDQNIQSYDVVFAGGVIYSSLYYQEFIKKLTKIAKKSIVIESSVPEIIQRDYRSGKSPSAEFYPIVEYRGSENGNMIHEKQGNFRINCAFPSIQALIILLEEFGFYLDSRSYNNFKNTENAGWPNRFGAIFEKKSAGFTKSTEYFYENQINDTIPWSTKIPETWKFDDDVAKAFHKHARSHIPDYDKVIDLSITLCKMLLDDPLNDRIIDVGCATGETINRLYLNGCCNLVGVDSSQAMLNHCDKNQAWYVCDTNFPKEHGPYDAVLCNWTMHFIKDKLQYLREIYQGLNPGGILILTEKTQNHGPLLELYHAFKRNQGVSEEEITAKSESLKNVMFIDSVEWYIQKLKDIGYTDISIINAAPCFTSFLAIRPN